MWVAQAGRCVAKGWTGGKGLDGWRRTGRVAKGLFGWRRARRVVKDWTGGEGLDVWRRARRVAKGWAGGEGSFSSADAVRVNTVLTLLTQK